MEQCINMITEKELEDYVTNCPTRHENKIGNKKQAIERSSIRNNKGKESAKAILSLLEIQLL